MDYFLLCACFLALLGFPRSWPQQSLFFYFFLPFCALITTSPAMAFDWQSELASTVKPPSPTTVVSNTNNPPKKSFAQAFVAATVTDTSTHRYQPLLYVVRRYASQYLMKPMSGVLMLARETSVADSS
jgi:hypothetical protein